MTSTSTIYSPKNDCDSPQLTNTNVYIHSNMVQGLAKPYKQEIEQRMQCIFDLFKNDKPRVHYLVINNGKEINPSDFFPNPLHPKTGEFFGCLDLMHTGLLRTNNSKSDIKWFSSLFRSLTALIRANYHPLVVIVNGYICDLQQIPTNGMDLVIEEEIIVRFPEEFL